MDKKEKRKIYKAFIGALEENIRKLGEESLTAIQAIAEAGSDRREKNTSAKYQNGDLSAEFSKQAEECRDVIRCLKEFKIVLNKDIVTGSVFSLKELPGGKTENYFLVRKCGGYVVKAGGMKITSISEKTPLAQAVAGKQKDSKVKFRDKNFLVVSVC